MDPYLFALALGGAGLVVMAVTGVAHLGGLGHGHTTGHSATSQGHPGGGHSARFSPPHGHGAPHGTLHGARGSLRGKLLTLASPRVLFSVLLGIGAAGLIAQHLVAGVLVPVIAVLGGVLFERTLVAPVWNMLFRFASAPAVTLDAALFSEARATSGFDVRGEGVIALDVDGQVVQCLGTLRPEDRALGVQVRAGDRLRVEGVDATRQRCTVSYLGHSTSSDPFAY